MSMKIINWITGRGESQPTPQTDTVDSIVDDFVVTEKPPKPARVPRMQKESDEISIDVDHYRSTHQGRIPVLIKPDLKIQELKRTLFGFEKNTTVGSMISVIAVENRIPRTKYHFYLLDSAGTKTLLPSHVILADLDVFRSGYLVVHMGTI